MQLQTQKSQIQKLYKSQTLDQSSQCPRKMDEHDQLTRDLSNS